MNIKIILSALFVIAMHASFIARAGELALETDPATFVLNGYAVHGFYSPDALKSMRFGLGTYKLDIPEVMVDMNTKNKDLDWKVKIKNSLALFTEYYIVNKISGTYLGLQLASQNYELQLQGTTKEYSNAMAMISVGYLLNITNNLYVKPWAGLGYQNKYSGDNCINDQCYDISPTLPFITLHLGYNF